MPQDDRNKLNRLEELKSKLFSKTYQTKIEHRNDFSHVDKPPVVDSWEVKEKTDTFNTNFLLKKTSMFKKFFIFSVIFFVLTLAYAGYVFFAGGNTVSNDNIDISVLGNSFTAGGEELPLIVGITNRNSSDLELADLIMQYPKGSTGDLSSDTTTFRESLGTIPSGAVMNENLKVTLFGEQGSVRPIKISLEYRVAGSNAIFVKDKLFQATISSTPINLSVDAPTSATPDQGITLKVKATLNATTAAPKILLRMDYPVGFVFTSAIPAPSFGNNVWNLGDLAPGAEHDISISGKMSGVFDGEQKTFKISTGSQSATDKSIIDVVFNSIAQTLTVEKPFIAANVFINGVSQSEFATDWKTPLRAEIHYANNLDTKVNDLQIVVKLSGNAIDRKTIIVPQGFYDSTKDTITWTQSTQNDLAEVNPGDTGSATFSFSPTALYSATSGIIPDPSINIDVDISGSQASTGFATNQLHNSTSAIVRIISDVGFTAKTLHYSGPITNTGLVPPKVGKQTTYTVVWTLSNTSNNISKTQVTASLPLWTDFVGPISPKDANLTYNSSTKEITWNVDQIARGAGITGTSPTVAFQISFTPSLSQVGTFPNIVNDATLTGHDDFAKVDVKVGRTSLNTKLDSDPTAPANAGIVVN